MAQATHAAIEWAQTAPMRAWNWHRKSNNLVILDGGTRDELVAELARLTRTRGVDPVAFTEPDLDSEITAVAASGTTAGKLLANYRLAGRAGMVAVP